MTVLQKMSRRANRCYLALALLAGGLAVPAQAQKAGGVDAVRPEVIVQRNAAKLPAAKGTDVSWDDLLRTGEQGRVRVMLLDQSLISVGPRSEVRVVRQAAASDQSSLELAYGKVRMRLAKQPGQRFELRTATAVAGVIGTDFGADASVPGTTHFICLEGEVRISSSDPKMPGTVICKGGYMTDVKVGQPPAEPTPATAEHMESWRRNNEPESGEDARARPSITDPYRYLLKSSIPTLASFRMPRSVPGASSGCSGTTQPTSPAGVLFFRMT